MWDLDYFQVSSRPLPIPTKIKQFFCWSRTGFEPTIFGSSDQDLTDRATMSRCKHRLPNVLRTVSSCSWIFMIAYSLDGINRIVIVTSIYLVRITAFTWLLKNYTRASLPRQIMRTYAASRTRSRANWHRENSREFENFWIGLRTMHYSVNEEVYTYQNECK